MIGVATGDDRRYGWRGLHPKIGLDSSIIRSMTGTDKGDTKRGDTELLTSFLPATGERDGALYDRGVSAPPEWIIRRGAEEFRAPSLEELLRWSRERRVVGTDLVFHAALGTWMSAHDVPQLAGVFPQSRSMSRMLKPLLLVGAVLLVVPVTGIVTCTGIGVVGALRDAHRVNAEEVTRRATKPSLIIQHAVSGVDDTGAEINVAFVNVSGTDLGKFEIEARWKYAGREIAVARHWVQVPPLNGEGAEVTSQPVELKSYPFHRLPVWEDYWKLHRGRVTMADFIVETERIEHLNAKILEAINSSMQMRVLDVNARPIPFLYVDEREAQAYKSVLDAAVEKARLMAQRNGDETVRRLEAARRASVIAAAVVELRHIDPSADNRIDILRSWSHRLPREERRFTADFETDLKRRLEELRQRANPPLTDSEVGNALQPVITELTEKWRIEAARAGAGKPVSN
jgi:hypothetical protein